MMPPECISLTSSDGSQTHQSNDSNTDLCKTLQRRLEGQVEGHINSDIHHHICRIQVILGRMSGSSTSTTIQYGSRLTFYPIRSMTVVSDLYSSRHFVHSISLLKGPRAIDTITDSSNTSSMRMNSNASHDIGGFLGIPAQNFDDTTTAVDHQ